eukprot:TRINITY_DN7409_c0_g1_i1.p1 TRINITY_DN7409_c0_g1~~TRINITY_DN7409_c0_g1_i1.p1  ORF type:complete len:184 (+),score=22.64 TRINITY_DN7409_c0_g1_i1:35-586(+)
MGQTATAERAQSFGRLKSDVDEANNILLRYTNSDGRRLKFLINPTHESELSIPFLWKSLTTITLCKEPGPSKRKLLSYKDFYFLYRHIQGLSSPNDPPIAQTPVNDGSNECVICMEREAQVVLTCGHIFCEECVKLWSEKSETCPMCRADSMLKRDEEFWLVSNEQISAGAEAYISRLHKSMD